ncbi:MAG: 30S ribosomal protein S16 [Dehalococcoidales bacterium]|jgi:small subunit ribosomal protein S16|nr:30S ribosomal protein S16 [Dehalococcoidia bacterium]NCG34745.1 30S ribosomal protein S16 [Dehalococcoidales bacterium]|tara:strand:+ start:174 stop:440 length:267 start_codon:yes stop_codon:yes gene_type:complete
MVRIRLRRMGSKGKPFYRIIVADQRAPRNGKYLDLIGTYDPLQDPPEISIDEEKITKWIGNGAQPSESVSSLLKTKGINVKEKANGKN